MSGYASREELLAAFPSLKDSLLLEAASSAALAAEMPERDASEVMSPEEAVELNERLANGYDPADYVEAPRPDAA